MTDIVDWYIRDDGDGLRSVRSTSATGGTDTLASGLDDAQAVAKLKAR